MANRFEFGGVNMRAEEEGAGKNPAEAGGAVRGVGIRCGRIDLAARSRGGGHGGFPAVSRPCRFGKNRLHPGGPATLVRSTDWSIR